MKAGRWAVLLAAVAACNTTSLLDNEAQTGACRNLFTGSYACADFTGQVLGSSSQAVPSAHVGIKADLTGTLSSAGAQTDAQGNYTFRVYCTRLCSLSTPVTIVATASSVSDTVTVNGKFQVIGSTPDPTTVNLHLEL